MIESDISLAFCQSIDFLRDVSFKADNLIDIKKIKQAGKIHRIKLIVHNTFSK